MPRAAKRPRAKATPIAREQSGRGPEHLSAAQDTSVSPRQHRARADGEFALIDAFLAPFELSRSEAARAGSWQRSAKLGARRKNPGAAQSGVVMGPGDDNAQLAPSRGMTLVATTDAAVDRVHFDLRRSSARDAGWKALAMNLSDLAAAGARPRWFLCALGVPALAANDAMALARAFGAGMAPLAKESGCALVGGNVTRAADWSLTITALGEAQRPLSRAGGQPGDRLILIGELGAAALGLQRVLARPARATNSYGSVSSPNADSSGARAQRRRVRDDELALLRAQLRPAPQLEAGQIAARFASAAIDVSDGLLQDLGHLCARSGCAATLDCDALPRSAAVRAAEARAARDEGAHPFALSLGGGEEYALLLAVPEARAAKLLAALARAKLQGRSIGVLGAPKRRSPGASAITLVQSGRALALPARLGHDHLA